MVLNTVKIIISIRKIIYHTGYHIYYNEYYTDDYFYNFYVYVSTYFKLGTIYIYSITYLYYILFYK